MKISQKSIKSVLFNLVKEVLSNEGVGYVYPKDRAKDPKSIPGEHWRIKYQSSKDLKKHGNTEISPIKETISKSELKSIIKEIVSEIWKARLNENLDFKPLKHNADEIENIIHRLREGQYVWFSYDNVTGHNGTYVYIAKQVQGDYYVYEVKSNSYDKSLDTDEDIQEFSKELAADPSLRYYAVDDIQGYTKHPREPEQDDQALGSYEINGADRPEAQY